MVNKGFNPNGIDYKLFTPGPVEVVDWVLKEMGKPNDTHRGRPYRELHKDVVEGLKKLLNTKNDVLLFANSATGVMEACVRNLIDENETGLFFSCGAFGDRWAQIAEANGKKAEVVRVEMGEAITPELVEETLKKHSYPVVFITFNETSTGVMNPLEKIAPIVKKTGALLCVDAVSAMAGVEIKTDEWGLDVVLASVQKCFGVPPGLAVAAISKDALEKAKKVKNRGFYLDFLKIKKKAESNEHPVTPPIPQIRALRAVVKRIIEKDPHTHYKEQEERTQMIREWAEKQGFEIFGPPEYYSKTVVTIKNNKNIDVAEFVERLWDKGYKIVNGYGKLKGKTFRIAAMGWITKEDTKKMLEAATEVLKEMNSS